MLLLGLDIESSGLDKKKDRIIELALVIVDTEFKDNEEEYIPVDLFDKLIYEPDCPEIHPEAYEITHITQKMLQRWGLKPNKAFCDFLITYFNKADYVVAANGKAFDKPMLELFFKRYDCVLPEKIWLDTQKDVTYPDSCKQRNQTYLSAYYGTYNPMPHRSITDVLMMFHLLGKYNKDGLLFPLDDIIKNATAVKIKISANVSFDDKELAKSDKFRWDSDGKDCGRAKTWWKEINENDYDSENYPFETEILPEKK